MNDILSIADQTLELSKICDDYASVVRDRARELWRAGSIDEDAYDEATAAYNQIRGKSRAFATQASLLAAQGIDQELKKLAQATSSLKQARARLNQTSEIVAVATKLVAMTTAIAAMALGPTPGSVVASVMAIKQVVATLGG
ncbi:MAG: hypothetical protein ACPG4T_11645 [Nannocystaceae bacterium]